LALGFAIIGACLPHVDPPPPIASGRYVLIPAAGSIPSLPITFLDSAGHSQRIFGDTIELTVANSTYREHGTVALLNADGTAQPAQSFSIGPKTYVRIDDHDFDLPSTIVGAARLIDLGNQPVSQLQLNKPGVFWVYALR
jgi:hypothetical protein